MEHLPKEHELRRAAAAAGFMMTKSPEVPLRYLLSLLFVAGGMVGMATDEPPVRAAAPQFRTLHDRFTVPEYTASDWRRRATYLREHILATAGLLPLPEKGSLNAQIFGEQRREHYSVFKVYFESLPGFYVTGNLYRPTGAGPFPAILSPHGHWVYGRLENTDLTSAPARAMNLAAQGFVVFTYDMIGYNDSRQLPHTVSHGSDADFGGRRENLWGLSLAGLQLWNSIRGLDFLESLPYVDRQRLGCTGESGGGTQTFLVSAVDERIKVSVPVNMISLQMQGGCLCENQPALRLDTNNVELAATIAPRPLLMVSATGDWTKETLEVEYPAMRRLYALNGAEDRVHAVRFDAEHNYNRDSREAMYAWMARWLKNAPADVRVPEREFRIERVPDLLVFYGRPLPDRALTREQFTDAWIAAARQQLKDPNPETRQAALRHVLAFERRASVTTSPRRSKTVIFAGDDAPLVAALSRAGVTLRRVAMTPFDAAAAAAISQFDTYNRTAASQRVADIVRAIDDNPNAILIARGEAALAAMLALAIAPVGRAILDVDQFDNTSDDAFVERLYIPGLRRAGDLQTAVSMASGTVVIHNAGSRFTLDGVRIESRKLTPDEIRGLLK
jgi:hypothetical protein